MKTKLNLITGVVSLCMMTAISHAQTVQAVSAASSTTVEGSPYLDESFVNGKIYLANTPHAVQIRYNVYQDAMEYKEKGQTLVIDPAPSIQKVYIGTTKYVVQKVEFKGKTKNSFLVQLDSGKATLYGKKVITFQDAKKGGALDGTDLQARYNHAADAFYIKVGDSEIQRVDNIKSLLALFPDAQEDMTKFAKKEKISVKKEKDLIQLTQYYNSLSPVTAGTK
jgi:hypothetical protein